MGYIGAQLPWSVSTSGLLDHVDPEQGGKSATHSQVAPTPETYVPEGIIEGVASDVADSHCVGQEEEEGQDDIKDDVKEEVDEQTLECTQSLQQVLDGVDGIASLVEEASATNHRVETLAEWPEP